MLAIEVDQGVRLGFPLQVGDPIGRDDIVEKAEMPCDRFGDLPIAGRRKYDLPSAFVFPPEVFDQVVVIGDRGGIDGTDGC
jgi:hypothetical protein